MSESAEDQPQAATTTSLAAAKKSTTAPRKRAAKKTVSARKVPVAKKTAAKKTARKTAAKKAPAKKIARKTAVKRAPVVEMQQELLPIMTEEAPPKPLRSRKTAAKKTACKTAAKKTAATRKPRASKKEDSVATGSEPSAPTPVVAAPEPDKAVAPPAGKTTEPPAPENSEVTPDSPSRQAGEKSPSDAPAQRDDRRNDRRQHGDRKWKHGNRNKRGRRDRNNNNRNRDRDDADSYRERPSRDRDKQEGEDEFVRTDMKECEGILEVSGKGFGFIRDRKRNFVQSPKDVFVRPEMVRKLGLRDGFWLKGKARRGGRGPQLDSLETINGEAPENYQRLPLFEELTAINPGERVMLETVPSRFTTRVIDMMAPIGKGQRGLIVAPPRTGKTTLLQHIAESVLENHKDMVLMILLVDERPEEVNELARACPAAEIMASSNDNDVKNHTKIAELCIDRAKRLVERGKDVFILMDSLTRIGRAFNNASKGTGRTLSGGMDARAMETPRRLFAAARNTEEAGSLTIIATALIDTGSRMDELIFQEFKGTGNMELVLDRKISDQRVYPAVDIFLSGTRREELLIPADQLEKISIIRRGLSGHKPIEAIERLLSFLEKFPTNEKMLSEIKAY